MIYNLFWYLANIAIRVFYGKIEVSGLENVPKDGPLLIASNHPNGFLEPIIIACLFPRPLHFMVRGDVFRKKWLKPILVRTNQIPIFRFKDGFKELRKNDSSLQDAYQALDNNAAIIIFIEGGTDSIKKLRPFQKGLARMAYSYSEREESTKELNVLPVAINFVSPFILRSRVILNVGNAFSSSDYFESEETKVKDIKRLTDDLYQKVLPLAFNVSQEDRQSILDKALKLGEGLFSLKYFPRISNKKYIWPTMKSISDRINEFTDIELESFTSDIAPFEKRGDIYVKRTNQPFGMSLFWTFIAFVPGLIGLVLNIIPGLIAKAIARNVLDESNTVFRSSIILCSGVGLYSVYYLLVIVILSFFVGWKALLFIFAYPLGMVYLFWKNNYRSSIARSKYHFSDEERRKLVSIFTKYKIDLQNIEK